MGFGLALSGGGLLGAAHIGVYKAFHEQGWAPEVVVGSSAGGLVGAAISRQIHPALLQQFGKQVTENIWRYFPPTWKKLLVDLDPCDLTHPWRGLLDPRPFVRSLLNVVGNPFSASGNLPLLVTTVDLATMVPWAWTNDQRLTRLSSWEMSRPPSPATALHSTMAMPGVFEPVLWNSHLFVDGGVADDNPANWLNAQHLRSLILVNAASPPTMTAQPMNIFDILHRSLTYMTQAGSRSQYPGLLTIEPDTIGIPDWDLRAYDHLVDLGYQAVIRQKNTIAAHISGHG